MSNTFVPVWTLLAAIAVIFAICIVFTLIYLDQCDKLNDADHDLKLAELNMRRVCAQRDVILMIPAYRPEAYTQEGRN